MSATNQGMPKGFGKAVTAANIGNFVEWLDYSIYGFVAPIIAAQFFPTGDSLISLIATYGIFAVGFLSRPFGAAIYGPYGDKHGRNKALAWTIILMGVSTGAIGLLPTYAAIGIWAPLLICFMRIIQGIACGGEMGAATAYVYELAPPHLRGFISSIRAFSTGMGWFAGTGMITLIMMFISNDAMTAWGWRLPFLLAFITGLVGFYIRRQVGESEEFLKVKESNEIAKSPLIDSIKFDKKGMAVVFGLLMISNSVYYAFAMAIPASLRQMGINYGNMMQIVTIGTLVYTVLTPLFGWLCDKYTVQKKLMAIVAIGYILISYPALRLLTEGNMWVIGGVYMVFFVLVGAWIGLTLVLLSYQFPVRTRTTSVAIIYAAHGAIAGGTTPMIITWLISIFHDPFIPAYYMIGCSVLSLIAVFYAKYPTIKAQASTGSNLEYCDQRE